MRARLRAGEAPASEQAKPTRLPMKRLRQLADTTGQTFAYPTTREAASFEIERMLGVTPLSG